MNNHVTKLYYKPLSIEKQACRLEDPVCLHSPAEIVSNLKDNYPPSRLRVLEVIMGLAYVCRFIFPSLDYIAAKAGVSKRTVTNCLQDLEEAGYISSAQRWNQSSVYKYSEALKGGEVLQGLWQVSRLFSALFLSFVCATPPAMATPKTRESQVRTDSCHLRNNLFINPPTSTHSHEYITGKETNPYDYIKDTSKLKTSEDQRRLMSHTESGIPLVIEQIQNIPLSMAGKCILSAFPDDAILYMVKEYTKPGTKKKENPDAWMRAVCVNYCRGKGVEPNWRKAAQLKFKHKISDGEPMLLTYSVAAPLTQAEAGVVKKEAGSGDKGAPSPRKAYEIPQKAEKTREEILYEIRTAMVPQKVTGIMDGSTEQLRIVILDSWAKKHPDIFEEAQRLGPLRTQSSEEAWARIDARLASKGARKAEYPQTAPPPPKRLNLTPGQSYSRVEPEEGESEY